MTRKATRISRWMFTPLVLIRATNWEQPTGPPTEHCSVISRARCDAEIKPFLNNVQKCSTCDLYVQKARVSHYVFYLVKIYPFCVKILTDIRPAVEAVSLVDYEIHTCVCGENEK